ncbi:PREDICTED: uncharacterized protein LOC106752079 [Dinoponera quadriceps]|uniref:Uncharacterized protein LOC106752079 n=1 Tax=Dinoponera quadriceps TaxID=609295 RepID=A0A6P3YGF0_DINQU|nr:PREDICTED: uncharacterized protein LOC106752079 [Dinoponera quadriceps]
MKLPFLILSLVLIHWTCTIYAEENVNSKEDVTNSGEEYTSNYQYVPLETSLSRHKRSILSPLMNILTKVLGKSVVLMFKPALDIFSFAYGTLIGKNECPQVEKLSLDLIPKIMVNPLGTIKTIICYVMDKIGSTGRALMLKAIEAGIEFTKRTLIPGLHTTLMTLDKKFDLPPSISAMIKMFDGTYKIMKLMGVVG